jgi:hypothetical protein
MTPSSPRLACADLSNMIGRIALFTTLVLAFAILGGYLTVQNRLSIVITKPLINICVRSSNHHADANIANVLQQTAAAADASSNSS